MIGLTHVVFALAVAYLLDLPVVYGMVASVFPDIDIMFDYGFPLTHRGVVHTPVAAVVAGVVVYLVTDRRGPAAAMTVGYLSHLFLDTFTHSGIMWLYPRAASYSLHFIEYANVAANLGITAVAVGAVAAWRYREVVPRWL